MKERKKERENERKREREKRYISIYGREVERK